MNKRLEQFIAAEGLTRTSFAERLDVVPAGITHIITKRNKPSYDFIERLMKAFPDLNINWLILGKGKMYNAQDSSAQQEVETRIVEIKEDKEAAEATLFGQEEEISLPASHSLENIEFPQTYEPSADTPQVPVKQRKAVKIAVFYDDGTFQELYC